MLFFRQSSFAILLVAQVTFCFAENAADLAQSVLQQKKSLPQELSSSFLLTDIDYNKQKQTLSYTVTAIDTSAYDINTSKITDSVCYKPQLRNAIKEGLAVSFFFYSPDKTLLNSTVITEPSCQAFIKKQDSLIQEDMESFNSTILPEKIDDNLSLTKVNYLPANQVIIADLKAKSNDIDSDTLFKFTCGHYYFKHMLNKNISIEYTALSRNIKITSQNCEIGTLDPLDNQLIEEAKKMKSNLKALSTNQIEIIDIGYDPKKKQVWNKAIIKIPNITKDRLNPNLNIRAICTTPSIRNIISQGISYSYSYYDMENKLIMMFDVNESTCKKIDQENNMLLKPLNK